MRKLLLLQVCALLLALGSGCSYDYHHGGGHHSGWDHHGGWGHHDGGHHGHW